jgi:hypothetical protein
LYAFCGFAEASRLKMDLKYGKVPAAKESMFFFRSGGMSLFDAVVAAIVAI